MGRERQTEKPRLQGCVEATFQEAQMIDMMIALLILSAIVGYWILCRKKTLKYQTMAVEAMEAYFDDDEIPDADKEAMYQDYKMCRSWYFLPLLTLMTPFALAGSLLKKQDVRPPHQPRMKQDLYDNAFSSMYKMMIIRSPLISITGLAFTGICFAFAIPIGIALNRMSVITEAADFMGFYGKISDYVKRKAHLH